MKNNGKKNAMINSKYQNRKYLERSTAHKNRKNLQTISEKKMTKFGNNQAKVFGAGGEYEGKKMLIYFYKKWW